MQPIPFTLINWKDIAETVTAGEHGNATQQGIQLDGLRIRMVSYSPGYLADHWCSLGHIVHCLEGSFTTRMENEEEFMLSAGMTYVVSDGMSSHRSYSEDGVKLLIVDGNFLNAAAAGL